MVCPRCIMAIEVELKKLNITAKSIELGEVDLGDSIIDNEILSLFADNISKIGFELIDDKSSKIVDKIKTLIIENVHQKDESIKLKFSEYLKQELNYDYNYLSNLFASIEGTTIEQFVIKQKIEKVKELLFYNELTLSEISYELGYSSVAHLSSQFKKITGMTPSSFKKIKDVKKRNNLDSI